MEIYAVESGRQIELSRECSLYIDGEAPEVSITGVQDYMITSQPVELHFAAGKKMCFVQFWGLLTGRLRMEE